MEGVTAQLHLTIETDSDPIAGSIAPPGEEPRRFDGWIELAAAIEYARDVVGRAADAGGRGLRAFAG